MPTYEVTSPEGTVYEVDAPDGATQDEVLSYAQSNLSAPSQPKENQGIGDYVKGLGMTAAQGLPFLPAVADEVGAGIAAPIIAGLKQFTNDPVSISQAYEYGLNKARQPVKDFRAENPKTALAAELTTAIAGGIPMVGAINALRGGQAVQQGGTALQGALRGAATGAGTGAVSGGLYGFGAGEDGASNRLASGAVSAALGGGIGGIGGAIAGTVSNSLANRANRLLEIKRAKQTKVSPPVSGDIVTPGPQNIQSDAIGRVIAKLRQDYPDEAQFQSALSQLKNDDLSLLEVGGEKVKDLALGAAQYPSGKGVTQEFFYGKPPAPGSAPVGGALDKARQNVTQSIEGNISGKEFFSTLDDVVKKGQAKVAPMYEKAFQANADINDPKVIEILQRPAGTKALNSAYESLRNEGIDPGNGLSLQLLDRVKKEFDDMATRATPLGARETGEGRAFKSMAKELRSALDDADTTGLYKKARETAGDYLSNEKAMKDGMDFMKANSANLEKTFKQLNNTEKESFRVGVVQKMREMADAVKDNGNVHSRVFGSPETRQKLKAILPEAQYKKLENDLWASDRIYSIRNRVLGNSTTASKQISAQEFASGDGQIVRDLARGDYVGAGINKTMQWVKQRFDGLSDKSAKEVARILTAKDKSSKLKIIRQIEDRVNPKLAAGKTNSPALKAYFEIEDMVRPYKDQVLGITGGNLGSQPLRVDIPKNYHLTPPVPPEIRNMEQ